jgi:hypothetical protein
MTKSSRLEGDKTLHRLQHIARSIYTKVKLLGATNSKKSLKNAFQSIGISLLHKGCYHFTVSAVDQTAQLLIIHRCLKQ